MIIIKRDYVLRMQEKLATLVHTASNDFDKYHNQQNFDSIKNFLLEHNSAEWEPLSVKFYQLKNNRLYKLVDTGLPYLEEYLVDHTSPHCSGGLNILTYIPESDRPDKWFNIATCDSFSSAKLTLCLFGHESNLDNRELAIEEPTIYQVMVDYIEEKFEVNHINYDHYEFSFDNNHILHLTDLINHKSCSFDVNTGMFTYYNDDIGLCECMKTPTFNHEFFNNHTIKKEMSND